MKKLGQVIAFIIYGGCGALIGYISAKYVFSNTENSWEALGILLIAMGLSVYLQIIIHELGHLVFGLISGYQFLSFRFLNLLLIKTDGKLKFKKMKLSGTAGQCLMVPPEYKKGEFPHLLYGLGGVIFNFLSAAICFGLWKLLDCYYLEVFFLFSGVISFAMGFANGIPISYTEIPNDGYNCVAALKSEEACYGLYFQLMVHAQLAKGKRLKELPEEWFELKDPKTIKNTMVATRAVLSANYLMDKHEFEEALFYMQQLVEEKNTYVVNIHKKLMICDVIYCLAMRGVGYDEIKKLLTPAQRKFMNAMKKNPAVIRTQYVLEKLQNKEVAAMKLEKEFEIVSCSYPYPTEIEGEKELMVLFNEKLEQKDF